MAKSRTFHVRIADRLAEDRYDDKYDRDTTIYSARFVTKEGSRLIRVQNLIKKGKYEALLLGMSVESLRQWLISHTKDAPEGVYNEIFDTEQRKWRIPLAREGLLAIID